MSEELYIELWSKLQKDIDGEKGVILDLVRGMSVGFEKEPVDFDPTGEDWSYVIKRLFQLSRRLVDAEHTMELFEREVKDPTK